MKLTDAALLLVRYVGGIIVAYVAAVSGFLTVASTLQSSAPFWLPPSVAGEPGKTNDVFGMGQSAVPEGLGGVIAIAAGGWSSLTLVGGPRLSPPILQADGSAEVTLAGIAGWSYTLWASANLTEWIPVTSFVAADATAPVLDPAAGSFRPLLPGHGAVN